MRLPFPERIPLIPTFSFAVAFCVIQLYEKTNPLFALACFFFLLVSAIAFNVAGGFSRPSGAYVFFYATLTVIIGLIWKAVLGEPADSNLQNPLLTISVFLSGICMMLVAVYFSTRLRTKRALLGNMVTDANMQTATVGCLICGILFIFSGSFLSGGNGSVLSALSQLNRFFPMAIILGVINAIRRSGGKRSISLPCPLAAGFEFGIGLLGFSKEGIITPFFCWTIAAASQGYKVSRTQIVGGILAIVFIFRYLARMPSMEGTIGRQVRTPLKSHSRFFQTSDMFESSTLKAQPTPLKNRCTASTTRRRGSLIVCKSLPSMTRSSNIPGKLAHMGTFQSSSVLRTSSPTLSGRVSHHSN